MITRVKLPSEDGFLEIANGDRDDIFRPKDPANPDKCECSCATAFKFGLIFSGVFVINKL
jgi:hypothetical protein